MTRLPRAWGGFCVVLALLATGAPVHAAPGAASGVLTVKVEGITVQGGMLRMGLYDRAHYDDDTTPTAFADVPAALGEMVVTLKDVPPGDYALEMFHDVNANGKMDTNWIGFPLEPYGFSRNARPFLSKPGFKAVRFTIAAGPNAQTVDLQNTVSFVARK